MAQKFVNLFSLVCTIAERSLGTLSFLHLLQGTSVLSDAEIETFVVVLVASLVTKVFFR